MKGEMEKSGRFLVIAIFFLFFISTAQGAWDNDDLMYANVLGTTEIRLPVHNINTVEDFENIQTAIDDPDTKDGHTISVDAGIYRERVVINKQLKLIGVNKDTTIIDGYGRGKCIQVTADNVEISGFTIKNGNYGIYLESSNCRVIDNDITSVDFDGISLRSISVNNTIAHNRLSKVKGKGIRLSSSCDNRIHDNDLSDNGKGISLSSSHNNIFYHNRLTNNSNCGICLSSSNNNTIQDNDLSGSEEGIFLRGCNKNYIYHNNFMDNRIQASDSSDTNRWDNGPIDGGNYWSDHKCTGNPSDGNQPYNISGGIMGATDFYPFMDRDGWLAANLTVTILYPNGGESIPVGTQVQVSVHATDDTAVTNVTFFYSSNGGSTGDLIGAGIRVSGTDKDGIWNGTWNTSGLSVGSNYLIKAVASDGTLTIEDLSESTFSLSCTPPSPPTLADPGTNDTDGNYTVSWSTVSSATNYTLEEDTSSSFSSPSKIYSGSGTSKEITDKSNGTYYYRVKACNECGCSEWSNIENINIGYITIDTISPNVTILYPTNEQTFTTTTITVKGTASDNVEVSKVEVKVGLGGWQTASGTTSWNKSVTLENGSNRIYARATDRSDNTNQTSVMVFVRGESNVSITVTSTISDGVTISGEIRPEHSAIVTLNFTTPAGKFLEESTTSTTNGKYKFDFTPYERGVWHVYASWAGDSDTVGNISDTVSFTVNRGQVYYALIIAGGKGDPPEPYYGPTANKVYKKLLTCGFTHKRIFYLNPSMEQDADGDGIYDVDRKSSLRNISYAINTWAQGNVSANDSLLLYMVAKGKENAFCVDDIGNTITATDLKTHLDNFTNATKCDDIVVVYDAHCSGSFIDELSGDGRIIITSTNSTTTALFGNIKGGLFSYYFFDSISARKTIKEAFEDISNSPEIKHDIKQDTSQNITTPLLDDNGDRVGHAIEWSGNCKLSRNCKLNISRDGSFAEFRYIGILYSTSPPTITDVIPSQKVVLNTPITIWAVVVHDSSIKEVYAIITEPNSSISFLYLEDPEGDANYTANFKPTNLGNYTLALRATDEEGNKALQKLCIIRAVLSLESAIFDIGEETYTYPWKGTGGHSEYEKIWNLTWKGVEAYFLGGKITHREFVDTKGHLNNNRIPAIKLEEV